MLINTGNISRKVLSKVLRSFVKNFERLQFELVYNESFKIVKEQGYLKKMLSFKSANKETIKQFELLNRDMDDFLRTKN